MNKTSVPSGRPVAGIASALLAATLGWAGLAATTETRIPPLELPDREIATAYEHAATQNVLAALNPEIFPGYWSVCADGVGFGRGNTYPSLDGHQMADALLFLGQVEAVKANWDYVRTFQRTNGQLPLAILPAEAGKMIGPPSAKARVDANGGLYTHWVPGDPLRALAGPTYIQNADVIFRRTLDRQWLAAQLPSVNLAADYLAALTSEAGAVKGAGYYLERPTRIESDGVTQGHAVDAFRRVAALNRVMGEDAKARRYEKLAGRIQRHFVKRFWVKDHFAEYLHPQRGLISSHGLTDVDWATIATGMATPAQQAILWPKLKDEKGFHYGGMPTGIASHPERYEAWEFSYGDRHDLAAMGRVWYLEAWARARMGDAQGLLDGLRKVSQVGRENGFYWGERYPPSGKPTGPGKYCEYPANLIRIVQRFVFGVDFRLDGSLVLAPTVTEAFWEQGFGQTVAWRDRSLRYRMQRDHIEGTYSGATTQRLGVRLQSRTGSTKVRATVNGRSVATTREYGLVFITLPATSAQQPCRFEITRSSSTPKSAASQVGQQSQGNVGGRIADGPDPVFEKPEPVTLAELSMRTTQGVSAVEVNDYAPGHYTGELSPSPPHADMNAKKAVVISWRDHPQRFVFSHEASYCPLLELPSGAAMCNQFFEGNYGDAELFNNLGRKERNSFVDIIASGPRRAWVRWTYFCVNMNDDTKPRLRGTEDYFAYPNGLVLRRTTYESLMPDDNRGYATDPIELFGVAPVGATLKDLFPRDAQQGDYHALAAVDLYADRRYDIYWDEKGGVRRRGDDATLAAISRSPGCALVLPFKEGLCFAVFGAASGFPAEKNQLIDHCTPGAEGGCGWGTGLWDHWPIGWLNSQTSAWKPASPYAYSFGSIGQFFVPDGKRLKSFGTDYPAYCKDRELNRWTARRVFYVLLGTARDWDEVRRLGRRWLDQGAACARPESIADLK